MMNKVDMIAKFDCFFFSEEDDDWLNITLYSNKMYRQILWCSKMINDFHLISSAIKNIS